MGVRERYEARNKTTKTSGVKERYEKRKKKSELETTIGFDTFESDLNTLGTTINKIKDEWQTEETMNNTRSSIVAMNERLGAYQEYRKMYGITEGEEDITKLVDSYKSTLDEWDDLTDHYGQFKTADDFKKALAETKRAENRKEKQKGEDIGALEVEIADLEKKYKGFSPKGMPNKDSANWKLPNESDTNPLGNNVLRTESGEIIATKKGELDGYTIGDLEKLIKDKKAYLEETKVVQEDAKYEAKAASGEGKKGYEQYLKFEEEQAAKKEEKSWFENALAGIAATSQGSDMGTTLNAVVDAKRADSSYQLPQDDWTEEEKYNFGARWAEDPQKAYDYAAKLNNAKATANKNKSKGKIEDSAISGFWAGAGNTAGAILTAPAGLVDYLDDVTDIAAGRSTIVEEDFVTPFEYSQTAIGGITSKLNDMSGTLDERIPIIGGKGLGDLYGLGTSIAQSAASAYTLGGTGTLISYFGQGAAAGVDDALSRGATEEQALLYGTILGAAEGVSEKIGIDNLFKLKSSKGIVDTFVNILKQAGAEGLEEGFSSIAGNVADNFVMRDKSEFNAKIKKYMESGMTEEQAKEKAWLDAVEGVAYDTLGGFISGGVHAGPQTAIATARENKQIKADYGTKEGIEGLIEGGLESGKETESYKLAEEYKKRVDNGEELSGAEIKRLKMANDEAYRSELSLDAHSRLAEYGVEDSELADIIAKKSKGEELTKAEKNILKNSEIGNRVYNDINHEELADYTKGMSEDDANLFLSLYDDASNGKISSYASSFNLTMGYAENNFSQDHMLKNRGVLTASQVGAIHKAKILNSDKALTNALNSLKEKHKGTAFIEGTFDDSIINYDSAKVDGKVNWGTLNPSQKKSIVILGGLGKRAGLDVELISDGLERGINGAFSISGNKMLIDIYAGMNKHDAIKMNDLIIPTISHELTHWMKTKSPTLYRKLDSYVFDTLMMDGKSETEILAARRKKMETAHPGVVYSDADVRDEVIARANEDIFAQSEEIKNMLSTLTDEEKKTFVDKVKEILQSIKDWLDDFLSKTTKSSADEAKTIREHKERIDGQIKLWDAMLVDSIEANQALKKESITGEELAKKITKKTTNESVQEMARDLPHYWYPNMSKSEISYVRRIAKRELNTTDNYIDIGNKWLYNETSEKNYFALYSTADANEPTILYACKGKRAEFEHQFLIEQFEKEVNNDESINTQSELVIRLLGSIEDAFGEKNVHSRNTMGRRSNNRNVGVYSKNSRNRLSEAFLDCIRNIAEIQERNRLEQYSDRDTDTFSRIQEMQIEFNELRKTLSDIQNGEDFKVAHDKLSVAISNGDVENGIKMYKEWQDKSGYAELSQRRDTLQLELENLRKSFNEELADKAIKEEKESIAKSGLSEADYFRKHAVKEFGYTPYFYDAGYITPNGKMLNFSGEKGQHFGSRGQDHRAIGVVYANVEGSKAMIKFMNEGNVRIMAESPGIDISTIAEPTTEQYNTIRKFIYEYANKGYFNVDLSDESGKIVGSLEYENNINPTRIINDIKNYYSTGEIRQQSNIDKFRYSDRDSDGNSLTEAQQSYFAESKVRDENGNLKVMYHGTPNATFTKFRSGTYFTEHKWYADRYQNQSASSLSYKKTADNPDTYAVYLDIKKPFDTRNPEEARIFNEEYFGHWGMGTPLMESGLPDWLDGGDLQEFLEEQGYDYDGLILDEGSVGGYGDEVINRGFSYVVFSPEQVKSVENKTPTNDHDYRFSMRENVEETKDLVAVHNLSEEKLLKSLQLGGLPMPSIAIIKARDGHNTFGNISLVFNKETIDPQFMRANKVYSGDAWTPTYPRIEHKINDKAQKKIANRINNLVPEEVLRGLGGLHIDSYNLEQDLNRHNGNLVEMFRYNTALKYAFLTENGVQLELPNKFKPLGRYSNRNNDAIIRVAENVSEEKLRGITGGYTNEQIYEVEPEIRKAVNGYLQEKYKKLPEKALAKLISEDTMSIGQMFDLAIDALNYLTDGIEQEVDYYAARDLIDKTIDAQKYESWIKELFANIVEKEGIRNSKDMFTPSGNRRSFEALHYEHNLENVIKAMKEDGTKGIGSFGRGNIFGASTTEYGSIAEIKEDAQNRMKQIPEEKYEEIRKGFSERFFELAYSLPIHKDSFTATDSASTMLVEAVAKFKTKSGMANYLRNESKGWANYSDYVVEDLIQLVEEIRQMPVGYFEAKPQRAIGFDEVATAIIPNSTSTELKTMLSDNGIKFIEYESGNEESRLEALNSLEDVKFSDRDTEGNELSKEQQDFFANSKVRDAEGNLIPVYHGTYENFTIFDINKTANANIFGKGHYFTSSEQDAHNNYASGEGGDVKTKIDSLAYYYFEEMGYTEEDLYDNDHIEEWNKAYDKAEEFYESGKVMKVYLNITNPVYANDTTELYDKDGNFISARSIEGLKELGFDGIIDYHASEKFDFQHLDEGTAHFVVFDSNQIKLTTNTNPTSNPDIRYSDRDNVSVYDTMGETDRLIKENTQLKEDVERLKERLEIERQVTHGNYFNRNQLDAVAAHIRNIANSDYDKKSLVSMLDGVYSYIAQSSDLNWEDLYSQCYDVARMVLDEAKDVYVSHDYYKMILRELRGTKISVNDGQIQNAKHALGNKWRNKFFNKITITDGARSLDSWWKDWSSEKDGYPDLFDANISDADQLVELNSILEDLKEGSEILVEYDMEEKTRWLAKEIYNQYWNVSPIRTTADKYDKQIKRLNFEHRQAMQDFRDRYEERMAEQKKADKTKYTERLKEIRDRKDREIAEVKKLSKERMDAYKENAERKTKIQSITANALTLNKWLVKNSKEEHIHKAMRGPVINLLNAIDFSSKQLLGMNGTRIAKRGTPTQTDISLSKALSQVKDMMADASVGKEELVQLYGHGLDDEIKNLVDSVDNMMRTVGDNEFILNQMSLEELETLDKIVKTIKHAVTQMNKFHTVNHAQGIANLSQEQIIYADSLGKEKVYDPSTWKGRAKKLLDWGNKLPYYAFKQFGTPGMKIYEALQDGWDKFAFNVKEIINYAESAYTNKEVTEWGKEIKKFKILVPANEFELADPNYKPRYQSMQMTIPQIMSLYCLQKRAQAVGHMLGGGIRVADIKGKNGELITQSEGVILTEKDIETIIGTLSDRQIAVADALQKFMNTTCTDWGNAVSMARFGYEAFGEENYFPIQSDKNNLAVEDETEKNNSLFRLLNMSFAKSTIENADNRIVISDIFDVFAQHTSDMAKYNALALPVLDAFRWYNYTEKGKQGKTQFITKSVKQSIENAFGKEGKSYITTFLKDINGQQEVSRDTLGKHFFTSAKIASVGMNIKVMLLQPTSYIRAGAVISNKYLNKALFHKPKISKAETYCGIALWKSMGYYDTNIQRGVEEQIKHQESVKDKAVEWSMKGAEVADKITWGYLWNACELEIRDTRKDLKVGSKEFYEAIGKRLREVIYATQVVDSTMTRSQMMRSSQMYDKMLTAFASEPTLAYNLLQDAYVGLKLDTRRMGKKEAWKKNRKNIAKVVTAYTLTNAMAALIESVFEVFRDDDEDEEMDMKEFMLIYLSNFGANQGLTTKIPYIKEIASILQGFSSSRTDTQWMQSFGYALQGWMKVAMGEGNALSATKNSIRTLSYLSGLPFYNTYRDFMAALNKLDILTAEDLEELFEDFFS